MWNLCVVLAIAVAACRFPDERFLGSEASVGDSAPTTNLRLIAPRSMSTVSQQKPTLRWEKGVEQSPTTVSLCKDRACAMPLSIEVELGTDGVSGVPSAPLPRGWVYWRVHVAGPGVSFDSPTWQFWVGPSNANSPVDTSGGPVLVVNGDGFPDFLVGAPAASSGQGAAHLYLGSATARASDWNGASPPLRLDLKNPDSSSAGFGFSVASVGDVNGDGYSDFVVGASTVSSGSAHLYLGSSVPSADLWNAALTAARLDLSNPRGGADQFFGRVVTGAWDLNGDGFADFLIPNANASEAHLYLGSAHVEAAQWNGAAATNRRDVIGDGGSFGAGAAGVQDINGDGYADFVVGNYQANRGGGGFRVYLGGETLIGLSLPIEVAGPDGTGSLFAQTVAYAGDVNGDGYSDFLIGADAATAGGAAHLYLGSAAPSQTSWTALATTSRMDLSGADVASSHFGDALASAGDVNGDGYGDFLVGAMTGVAHLYLGATDLEAPQKRRIDLTGSGGVVSSAGDVNGDGYADFLVGSVAGDAHLYLGSSAPTATSWNDAASTSRVDLVSP